MAVVASMNSGFDYYSPLPVQNSIEKRKEVEITPITALQPNTPFEFQVVGSEGEGQYLDLVNSYFLFRVQALTSGDADPDAAAEISCTQNLAHTMFQRVEVWLNDKPVADTHGMYGYASYLADLLSWGTDAKDYWMQMQGWWGRDTAGKLDGVRTTDQNHTNKAAKLRNGIIGTAQKVELIMRPHVSIFNSDKFIPPGIRMKIRFTPAASSFVLTRGAANDLAKFTIKDAKFYCQMVKATHSQDVALMEAVREVGPYRMNINHVTLKTITIPAGQQTATLDNIINGPIPNRTIVAMVADAAFNGSYITNPLNFQHFNLSSIHLSVNGESIPQTPYSPNFAPVGSEIYKREYKGLLDAMNRSNTERVVSINPEEFIGGYTVFAFDLTPDKNCDRSHSPQGTGSVRLILKFSQALNAAVVVLVHSEFDAWIDIDQFKNVTTSF